MRAHPQRPPTYQGRAGSTADLALSHLEQHGPTAEIALAAAIDKEVGDLGALLAWPVKQGAIRKEVVGDEWLYSMGDGVPLVQAQKPPEDPPVLKTEDELPAAVLQNLSHGAQRAIINGASVEQAINRKHPRRGLNAVQTRGEVMEPEGCASPNGRGGDAAPARAVGPVFMHASQAGPASDGSQKPTGDGHRSSTAPTEAGSNTPRPGSQQVLKAEGTSPDATARDAPSTRSPAGGPMGEGQPAAAGPADDFRVALWSDGTLEIRRPGNDPVKFSKIESRAIVSYLESISLDPVREENAA